MLAVSELLNLQLGKLKATVDDWQEMARKLRRLADSQGEGKGDASAATLRTKALGADWAGVNAGVNRKFVTQTASEFGDAVTAATSIHSVLRDAHSAFTRHKDELSIAVADATKRNIYINDKGGATPPSAPPGVAGPKAKDNGPTDQEVAAAEQTVTRILREADDTDRVTARALRALARDKHNFTDTAVDGLKSADESQGKADATYWVKKIGAGDVNAWSDEELARFKQVLAIQRDNPAFTVAFATGLKADGTLQFWRDLTSVTGPDGRITEGIDAARAKLLGQTQDNLSLTLANATRSPEMDTWKKDLIEAGGKQFPIQGQSVGPYGYQIMGNLMHKGKFETQFLQDYGKSVLEFERKLGNTGPRADPGTIWDRRYDTARLDYASDSPLNDPVGDLMEALGHNPEASLKFFNSASKTGGDGFDTMSNWDYLVGGEEGSREWPEDQNGKTPGYDKLGHALESATLGYAYDDPNPSPPKLQTPDQIAAREARMDLVGQVVETYKSKELIDGQPGIRDSLARIGAGHVDSLTYTMANFGGSGELAGRDGLFNADSRHLQDVGESNVKNFLRAISSDQESYETVSAAQQAYGSSLMAAQGDNHGDAKDAGLASIRMHGMMDEARFEAIGEEFGEDADGKNKELEKQGEWRNFLVSAGVGTVAGAGAAVLIPTGAAAVIAVPLAFDVAGGAAESGWATNTIEWLSEVEYDNRQDSIESIQDAQQVGERNAMTPLLNYAAQQKMPYDEVRKFTEAAELTYSNGARKIDTDDSRGH